MELEKRYQEIVAIFSHKSDYDFDSHEFITVLKKSYPGDYYKALLEFIPENQVKHAYQLLHAQLGKDLSRLKEQLGIQYEGKHLSPNYRDEETENAKWKKQ